jgi:Ca2+-transporting ATPase
MAVGPAPSDASGRAPAGEKPPQASIAPAEGAALHAIGGTEVLRLLGSSLAGLSTDAAQARLARCGPNAIASTPPTSAWKILVAQLRSVVVLLLVVAAVVSLAVGDVLDAAAVGGVLLINTALGFVIELRARRAMEALLDLEVARATVLRDGGALEIDADELVPGDVITLEAGGRVPADARLLQAADLRVDEAALTGESLPVVKHPAAVAADTALADRTGMLYLGTTVVAGAGLAVVVATGMTTELGRVGALVGSLADEPTPLERRLDALGRRLVGLALAAGAAVAILGALRGLPWVEIVATGLALAVAAVPEGLPAVATVTLALAVHRMARRHALVRRLPSVETLGSVTTICTDKTGTLTAGQVTLTVIVDDAREIEVSGVGYAPDGEFRIDGAVVDAAQDARLATALRVALLANHATVRVVDGVWRGEGDPTEAALLVAGHKAGLSREELLRTLPLAGEVPFASERMWMATFHHQRADSDLTAGTPEGDRTLLAHVKGAPARVLAACSRVLTTYGERPLSREQAADLLARNERLAARGLRVLALAIAHVAEVSEDALTELTFVALVGMTDPIAAGVLDTVATFRAAGIRVLMITGDQRMTARAIGRQLGIVDDAHDVLDGHVVATLDDAQLADALRTAGAVSRISPEDKLRIVASCQARGEVVAMLGDGVNDAAALRKADVGVAMGGRGTDVAKEAADVVLEDDRFATIAPAIEQGRVVFDDIGKFVLFLFGCNLAEVLVLVLGTAAALEVPLLPLQILWLNLVTDTFPALALALEPAEPGIMQRPPRDPREELFSRSFLRAMAIAALSIAAATLAAFVVGHSGPNGGPELAVTMSFSTLAIAQAFHLGNRRSRHRVLSPRAALANPWAIAAVLAVVALQIAAVHWTPLSRMLRTVPLDAAQWLWVVVLAAMPAVLGEMLKPSTRRRAAR